MVGPISSRMPSGTPAAPAGVRIRPIRFSRKARSAASGERQPSWVSQGLMACVALMRSGNQPASVRRSGGSASRIQRDQAGGRGADIDGGGERQARLACLEDVSEGEAVHQHRLAPAGNAVDQLEAVVLALLAGPGQHLAVRRPEHMVHGLACERRGTAGRQQAERLGKGCERRLGGAAAAEAGHGSCEGFEGIAHQRREHRLAPALRELLQAPEAARQLFLALFRRHPGEEPEPEPHDGPGGGVLLGQRPHGVAHGAAVWMGEGEEGRGHTGHTRTETPHPAALDQDREAAGQAGLGEALHQLGEGPGGSGAEGHVQGAVEAPAHAQPGADPRRLPDQELGGERRREGADLGRLGRPRRCVVTGGHRAPVGGRRVRAVDEGPNGPERRVVAEPLRLQAALVEEGVERVHQRQMAWRHAVQHGVGALGLAGLRQPVPSGAAGSTSLRLAPGLGCRQARGPGPAGEDHGLGREQGREEAHPLGQHVLQGKAEPLRLTPGPGVCPRDQRPGLVGRPLQHQVQDVAGLGQAAVEAPAGELHEALQLGRARHGAGAVEAEQGDQRAVAAGEQSFSHGGFGQA